MGEQIFDERGVWPCLSMREEEQIGLDRASCPQGPGQGLNGPLTNTIRSGTLLFLRSKGAAWHTFKSKASHKCVIFMTQTNAKSSSVKLKSHRHA